MLKMILTGTGTAFLVMYLGVGWIWALALEGTKTITAGDKVLVALSLTIILATQQLFLVVAKIREVFRKRKNIVERRPTLEKYLKNLLYEYYQQHTGKEVAVRVNLMLPRIGVVENYLKIEIYACPPEISYSREEQSLKWKERQGACGWAWKYGNYRLYDHQNEHDRNMLKTLNKPQLRATHGVNTILSFPVKCEDDIVGVLNLDSQQTGEETGFTDPQIIALATKCADDLGIHCC